MEKKHIENNESIHLESREKTGGLIARLIRWIGKGTQKASESGAFCSS